MLDAVSIKIDETLELLNTETWPMAKLKLNLESIKTQMDDLRAGMSMDRETFTLDYDLQLIIKQLDSELSEAGQSSSHKGEGHKDLECTLSQASLQEYRQKLIDLLNKLLKNAQRLHSRQQKAKPARADFTERRPLKPVPPPVSIDPPRVELSERALQPTPVPMNAVQAANKFVNAEQQIIQKVVDMTEQMNAALDAAEAAERQAALDANHSLDQTRLSIELMAEVEQAARAERAARSHQADLARALGMQRARVGQIEQIQQELASAEGRITNVTREITDISQHFPKLGEASAPYVNLDLIDNLEQIFQVQQTFVQAEKLMSWGLSQLQNLAQDGLARVATIQDEHERALKRLDEAGQQVLIQEAAWHSTQDNLQKHQLIIAQANEQARASALAAQKLRTRAHEAVMAQQALAAERAAAADQMRLAALDAADSERSRILAELMSRGDS